MSGFDPSAFANKPVRIKSTGDMGITTGVEVTPRLEGGIWLQLWEVGVRLPSGRVAVVPVADVNLLSAEAVPAVALEALHRFEAAHAEISDLFEQLTALERQPSTAIPNKQALLVAIRERIAAVRRRLAHMLPKE